MSIPASTRAVHAPKAAPTYDRAGRPIAAPRRPPRPRITPILSAIFSLFSLDARPVPCDPCPIGPDLPGRPLGVPSMSDPRILDPDDFADESSDLLSLEVVSVLWLTCPEQES